MSNCPSHFRKPSCTGEKMWQFVGDDGKQYANLNGPIEMAMLCIGHNHPHLVDLRMCVIGKSGKVVNVRNHRRNLNELFEQYKEKRPVK